MRIKEVLENVKEYIFKTKHNEDLNEKRINQNIIDNIEEMKFYFKELEK